MSKELNNEIELASRTAFQAAKGGDSTWDIFMQRYGVMPMSTGEREKLINGELKITRGALPIEVRRVFEQIQAKYPDTPIDIDSKVKEYYGKIKPFGGMSDIFSNAVSGSAKYSTGLQNAKHKTMTCKCCGAPRLEEDQYDNCLYCGSKLFERKE